MAKVFFSYSHADEALRDQLEKQLAILQRQGLLDTWHDRRIPVGAEIDQEISSQMEAADILLLLISPDFISSNYCYDVEMKRAMERHESGEAKLIPVILRPCDWHHAPFGKLLATPIDGKPITRWPDIDEAFLEVAKSIRAAVEKIHETKPMEFKSAHLGSGSNPIVSDEPRSSNLRIKKEFSDRDKDKFKVESFEYMAKFFENSLQELQGRNEGVECEFRRVDGNRFTAAIYKHGNSVAKCTIFMGGDSYFGKGISFVFGETSQSNSYNESLTAQSDDVSMFLSASGMASMMGVREQQRLTQQGASEMYWSLLIHPLQSYN